MYLAFDIGGTKTRLARSLDGKKISKLTTFPTRGSFKNGITFFLEEMSGITDSVKPKMIVGGIAGVLNRGKNKLLFSPNLPGWVGKPIKATIERVLNAPIVLENDAALAGLGEAISGAGCGFGIVAYITVSTGVGGVRIVDGKIDRNSFGFEPGRQFITENYNLESLVSGAALQRRYSKKPEEIRDPSVWRKTALDLSRGLHNVLVLWSPDVLVLGGPMILGKPRISLTKIKQTIKRTGAFSPCKVKKAELDDLSGIHGALILGRFLSKTKIAQKVNKGVR